MEPRVLIAAGLGALALACAACGPKEALSFGQRSSAVETAMVASLQYASGQHAKVKSGCSTADQPDVCAVQELVSLAHEQCWEGLLLCSIPLRFVVPVWQKALACIRNL